MTDFREMYKQVGYGLQNPLANQRVFKRERLNDQRHNKRNELFSTSRNNLQGPLKEQETKKVDKDCANRLQTLAKWREERNRRKLIEKALTKPPFKVGIVRHRWYSPPITKDEYVRNKQKRENMRNKKNKVIKKVPVESIIDHQFKAPIGFNAISCFDRRVVRKGVQTKNDLQNIFNDSTITFLPEEFDTSSPIQTEVPSSDKDTSPKTQGEEELTVQYYKCLSNQEIERLIGLHDLRVFTKNEESTTEDIYHLIEECHARFKKFEKFEKDNWTDEEACKAEAEGQLKKYSVVKKVH